jgi:hypothetical protein
LIHDQGYEKFTMFIFGAVGENVTKKELEV